MPRRASSRSSRVQKSLKEADSDSDVDFEDAEEAAPRSRSRGPARASRSRKARPSAPLVADSSDEDAAGVLDDDDSGDDGKVAKGRKAGRRGAARGRATSSRPARKSRARKSLKEDSDEDEVEELGDEDVEEILEDDDDDDDDDEEARSKPARRGRPKRKLKKGAGKRASSRTQEDDDRRVAERLATMHARNQPQRTSRVRKSYVEADEDDEDILEDDEIELAKNRKSYAEPDEDEFDDESESDVDEDSGAAARRSNKKKSSVPKPRGEQVSFTPQFPDALEVDKVLGVREKDGMRQFLIKFKGYSYLHTEWRSSATIKKKRIEKFLASPAASMTAFVDEDEDAEPSYFSADFTAVHRILAYYEVDVKPDEGSPFGFPFEEGSEPRTGDDGRPLTRYSYVLVKWSSLPYTENTWEPTSAIDDAVLKQKLAEFRKFDDIDYKEAKHRYAPMRQEVRRSEKFVHLDGSTEFEGLDGNGGLHLRDYQVSGVNWMLLNWNVGRAGCLLADEMGLGKTIQVVGLVEALYSGRFLPRSLPAKETRWMRTRGPHLIVVPLSCVFQWEREFATWTKLNAVIFHGVAESRELIKTYEFFFRNAAAWKGQDCGRKYDKEYTRFDVLITTYEIATRDAAFLRKFPWRCIVVDEAHRLKNWQSKLAVELGQYERDFTVLLTGTPIQNNTEELWALFHFLTTRHRGHPLSVKAKKAAKKQGAKAKRKRLRKADSDDEVGDNDMDEDDEDEDEDEDDDTESVEGFWFRAENREKFMAEFGDITNHQQATKLHKLLRPFLLRRIKEDVGKQMPPKVETIVEVELTSEQKKYYRSIYERNTKFLFRGGNAKNGPSLMNVMMELRKCCNHPFLIRGAEERILDDVMGTTTTGAEETALKRKRDLEMNRLLVEASGKLVLLDKLLPKLKDGDHRVLIFSQMTRMLDILEDYLRMRGFLYERMDGQITGMVRQAAIDRFSAPGSNRFVMLLSTRAGGLGLNLACADTVIIYDSDWNPQNDMQAQARSHRIGQTKPVKIYRLLTRKTYEMAMFDAASMKLGLDRAMLSVDDAKGTKPSLSAAEVDRVLKHGAYAAFAESEEDSKEASRKFLEADIDEILDKSTHVVNHSEESEKKKSALSGFSTAVFVNPKQPDGNVNVDDPEFWTKVAGFERPEMDVDLGIGDYETEMLIMSGRKRNRKAVQRMGMVSGSGHGDPEDLGGDSGLDDDEDEDGLYAVKKRKTNKELKAERKRERELERERRKAEKFKARLARQQQRAATSGLRARAPSTWSSHARNKLLRGLQRFGWGRWFDIRRSEQLDSFGDEYRIMRFSCVLVRVLHRYAKHDFDNAISAPSSLGLPYHPDRTARAVVEEAEEAMIGADEIEAARKLLSKAAFLSTMLAGDAKRFLQRVEMLHHIHAVTSTAEQAADETMLEAVRIHDMPVLQVAGRGPNFVPGSMLYCVRIPASVRSGIAIGAIVDDKDPARSVQWVVNGLVAGSAADKTGFLCRGDVLVALNGFPASSFDTVRRLVEAMYSPHTVSIDKSSVELGPQRRKYRSDASTMSSPDDAKKLGAGGGGGGASAAPATATSTDALANTVDLAKAEDGGGGGGDDDDDDGDSYLLFMSRPGAGQARTPRQTDPRHPTPPADAPLEVKVVDYFGAGEPDANMPVAQVLEWIAPAAAGRENLEPLGRYLRSEKCAADAAVVSNALDRLKSSLGENASSDATAKAPEGGSATLPLSSGEIEIEQMVVAVQAGELHRLEILSTPDISQVAKLSLMDKHPWTREMDMHLVLGINRHGLGAEELQFIAADPGFIFAQIIGVDRARSMLQARLDAMQSREDERKARSRDQQRRRLERKKEMDQALANGGTDATAANSSAAAAAAGAAAPGAPAAGEAAGSAAAGDDRSSTPVPTPASELPLPVGPASFLPPYTQLLAYVDQVLYRNVRASMEEDNAIETPAAASSSAPAAG